MSCISTMCISNKIIDHIIHRVCYIPPYTSLRVDLYGRVAPDNIWLNNRSLEKLVSIIWLMLSEWQSIFLLQLYNCCYGTSWNKYSRFAFWGWNNAYDLHCTWDDGPNIHGRIQQPFWIASLPTLSSIIFIFIQDVSSFSSTSLLIISLHRFLLFFSRFLSYRGQHSLLLMGLKVHDSLYSLGLWSLSLNLSFDLGWLYYVTALFWVVELAWK